MQRRTFLALGVTALALAGCTGGRPSDAEGGSQPPRPPAKDPDAELRERVAASESALIAAYRAALAAHPDLAPDLGAFVAHHEAHLARVAPLLASPGAQAGSPAPPGDATAEPSSDPAAEASTTPGDPDTEEATLERLAEAEAAAVRDRVAACDAADSSILARDLCVIAASEAQHRAEIGALLDGRRAG